MRSKVVIIGAGSVGTTIAYALMIKNSARTIVLVDINEKKVRGEVLDLNHGRAFVEPVEIKAGTYEDCSDADIVIITAGAKQKPGESRTELLKRNISICKSIVGNITSNLQGNQPIILLIANPVDILTYFTHKFSNLPANKVLGTGTVLDSSRLRYEISNYFDIDARNVHGYVVGEHGDSEVILWDSLTIGTLSFMNYCKQKSMSCTGDIQKQIVDNVRNAAYYLIETKGYTNYAIGLTTSKVVAVILNNQHSILPVSAIMQGQYGIKDVALSVPSVVGNEGVKKILEVPMSEEELTKFKASSEKLKQLIESIET